MNAASRSGGEAEESLKRLGGGRWQTRDERFTIEPQSGTWAVVDAEETDDLGLPLVRGPFRSLTDAKAAIADARAGEQPTSPLAARVGKRDDKDRADTGEGPGGSTAGRRERDEDRSTAADAGADKREAEGAERDADERADTKSKRRRPATPAVAEAPSEPGWFRDLSPTDRGRARRLIERLTSAGHPDAISVVRRDLVGDVPAIAAAAIERRLADLGDDAPVRDVVELLADGRDEALGVRWRIVDGDGRPILIEPPKLGR